MSQAHIIAVGGVNPVSMFQDCVAQLRTLGYAVVVYEDPAAFQHAAASLMPADVVLAAPRFACSRALMAAAPRLRGLVSPITGIDGFDVAAATELGILIANGQTSENTESMAEATILLILAALYDLHGTEAVLRQHLPRPVHMNARMLRDKAVGLIGFGQIARAVAVRLAGWHVTIQAYTRRVRDDAPNHVHFVALDALLRTSDVVCVLTTLNSDSRGLLNAERLRLLKRHAVVVNTARGAIIDEAALCDIARQRPDLRFALDTFTTEPLPPQSPLREMPHAILTPHMLGHTQESHAVLPDTAVENVQRILAGQVPRYVCNPDVIPRWQARWAPQAMGAAGPSVL
jgi:phosphoglycerate dehydrogenase-like enzyme